MEEREIKIVLVPKEWMGEDKDMYRVSCENMRRGWGITLSDAIKDFDEKNSD